MGHGKETPRQKMIGMMYLVLTALLALNVSAEVLNAFILVNDSLTKTIENTTVKNEGVYKDFELQYSQNPTKVKEWYEKAKKIKSLAKEINDTIINYKRRIVQVADKIPEDQWNDSLFSHVKAKDDNNVPGQIMILEGNGERLKLKINEYREKLVSLVDTTKMPDLAASIRSTFNTDDVIGHDGAPVGWEYSSFDHLPLMGVITILTKIQTDVRNSESDLISYFYQQIDAKSWKFNKIEAFVNAPRSYVLKGGTYEAEVFIAASDSTVTPKIVLTGGQQLKVKEGKGVYVGGTGSTGLKRWGGVIKYPSPSGAIVDFPFKAEYEVGEPSLTVSPTKMNVFYIGVKNPVEIAASGVPKEKVRATISTGSLKRDGNAWAVRVSKGTKAVITASAEINGKVKQLGKKTFRIKPVPDPVAKALVADKKKQKGGMIRKQELLVCRGVKADLENFDFDLKFRVTEFTVSATLSGGFVEDKKARSGTMTPAQKKIIQKVKPGKKVYIENIKAVGPDKRPRDLGSLSFKVM